MQPSLRISLAQMNPKVGAISDNRKAILEFWEQASAEDADLVVFPELALTGYPPEDLILKPFFHAKVSEALNSIVAATKGSSTALLLGAPYTDRKENHYNSAYFICDGTILGVVHKRHLPNYHVFDEKRIFSRGEMLPLITFRGVKLGVLICEDMWFPDVTYHLAEQGADLLISLNASPFEIGKRKQRLKQAKKRVKESGLPLIYVNQVGGQDELVFDGASFVMDSKEQIIKTLPYWKEGFETTTWNKKANLCVMSKPQKAALDEDEGDHYTALVIGLRDYIRKNGFKQVMVGLSGGVDSALVAAICTDALGADAVRTYMLTSPYTSEESIEDAEECAALLGIRAHHELSILPGMESVHAMLSEVIGGRPKDITAQNIQSRLRGLILMSLSNEQNALLISTSNKSEIAVGYATLYGDMCGAFNPLKDLYKTKLYELCRWRNKESADVLLGPKGRVIPERVLRKAPSAELKPNQTDQDSLPPYPVLDDILECLIEKEMGAEEIMARGHEKELINRVWRMLDMAEYKRRQSSPGVKITTRAFGKERRYPITNGFTSIL